MRVGAGSFGGPPVVVGSVLLRLLLLLLRLDAARLAAAAHQAPWLGAAPVRLGGVADAVERAAAWFLFLWHSFRRALADLQRAGRRFCRELEAAADAGVIEALVAVEGIGGVL